MLRERLCRISVLRVQIYIKIFILPKVLAKKNGENARTSRPNHAREADVFRPANDGSPPAERIKTRKKQALQPLGIVKPAPNFADVQTEPYERLPRKIRPANPAPIPETL
jgi:hypothetical protein